MELYELLQRLVNYKNGTYILLEYETQPTTRAKYKGQLIKKGMEVFRLGVDYSKMKINEGKEINSLPFGEWVEGMKKFIIFNEKKNQYYLRVTTTNNKKHKIYSDYYLNGEKIEYDKLVEMGVIAPTKNDPSVVKNFKIENIKRIGRE